MHQGFKILLSLFLCLTSSICYAEIYGSAGLTGSSVSSRCDGSGTAIYLTLKNNTSNVCKCFSNGIFRDSQVLFEKNTELKPGKYYYLAFDKGSIWGARVILLFDCVKDYVRVEIFSHFKNLLLNKNCNAIIDTSWFGGTHFVVKMLENSPQFPINDPGNSPHINMSIDENKWGEK